MASQRAAKIAFSRHFNSETVLLDLVLPDGEILGFVGGQYIILNTNLQLPDGKTVKRAYSILSSDAEQRQFSISVKRVGGPGSGFLHQTPGGADLHFSGPWGQFVSDANTSAEHTLVLATDTGMSAALGLAQSVNFKSQVKSARIVWMAESANYFLPESFVESLLSKVGFGFRMLMIPAVNHTDRVNAGLKNLRVLLENDRPESVFLSGDGALLYPFKEELLARGVPENQIKIECYFNNPFKKVVARG